MQLSKLDQFINTLDERQLDSLIDIYADEVTDTTVNTDNVDDWVDSMMMGVLEDITYWFNLSHYSPILYTNYVQQFLLH